MKKFLPLTAVILLFAFTSAKIIQDERDAAIVNKEHGLYVFVDSRPTKQYNLINSIEAKRVNIDMKSLQSYQLSYMQLKDEIFRQMEQKKNKEKFAGAEAIIIYPEQQKADVIKFK